METICIHQHSGCKHGLFVLYRGKQWRCACSSWNTRQYTDAIIEFKHLNIISPLQRYRVNSECNRERERETRLLYAQYDDAVSRESTQRGEIDCVFHSRGFNTTLQFSSPPTLFQRGRNSAKPNLGNLLLRNERVKLIFLGMSVELFCREGKILLDLERDKRRKGRRNIEKSPCYKQERDKERGKPNGKKCANPRMEPEIVHEKGRRKRTRVQRLSGGE